jgi:hypothetical protein
LSGTRLESVALAADTVSLRLQQNRKPLHFKQAERIRAAQDTGMQFLRTGSRWFSGAGRLTDNGYTFFEPDKTISALAERMGKVNEVAKAIQAIGLGYATAVCLGVKFSARADSVGEWWLKGLGRAQEDEQIEVQKAIKEWADGDSIAAHVGYGIDLFCTGDKGGSAGGKPSVLDTQGKAWLASTYGVKFVTLMDLAAMM